MTAKTHPHLDTVIELCEIAKYKDLHLDMLGIRNNIYQTLRAYTGMPESVRFVKVENCMNAVIEHYLTLPKTYQKNDEPSCYLSQ